MKRFLLPLAALALVFAGCGDDETPPAGETDTGSTSDVGLDLPIEGDAVCEANCAGRECGDDGCGGSCGECGTNFDCVAGACIDNTPAELDCPGVIECINASGGGQADLNECISQGDAEAQGQINDIIACLQENCGEAGTDQEFEECQQEFCQGELNACFGIGEGTDTCEEVVDCLLGCTTQECANACVGEGTPEAQEEAVAGFNCAAENCAEAASVDEFFACFEETCTEEYNACYDISVVEDPTCEAYCTLVGESCAGDAAQYESEEACLAYCNTAGGFPAGTSEDTDGNTIGCRMYHATVAGGLEGDDNALHCGHAGPSGGDVCGTWCENYCDLATNNCTGDNALFGGGAGCLDQCEGFHSDAPAGSTGGDSVQCRIYHLGVAGSDGETSAATHCPHGGVDGGGVCEEVEPGPTCEAYCGAITEVCTGDAQQYDSEEACMAYCTTAGAFAAGEEGDAGGNTIGCRDEQVRVARGLEGGGLIEHCTNAGPSGANVCGSWCDNYCDLAMTHCTGDNELYADSDECEAACSPMPRRGEAGDTAGDSVQCRIYHLGVAGSDGETSAGVHCSHGGEDGDGVCVDG